LFSQDSFIDFIHFNNLSADYADSRRFWDGSILNLRQSA